MKKQYLLLLALAAALANSLVAMEDPNDQRGQKRKRDEIVKSQANEGDEPKLKEQKVDEEEKPFGDLSILPDEILVKILSETGLSLDDLKSLSCTNTAFNKFVKGILSKIRTQVLKELDEYKAQHQEKIKSEYNVASEKETTAFHIAAMRNDKKFIERYLPLVHFFKRNVINQQDPSGKTPLDIALTKMKFMTYHVAADIADLFIQYGGIANTKYHREYLIVTLNNIYKMTNPQYNDERFLMALSALSCETMWHLERFPMTMLSALSCEDITYVYHKTTKELDFKHAAAFIREYHKCEKCFPDNQ